MDAEGDQALAMVVLQLGLFCVGISWVGDCACMVGCAQQAANIVQAFWQKVLDFYGKDREIQQGNH